MRRGAIILPLLGLIGCATRPSQLPTSARFDYDATTASALVFDPPIAAGEQPVELSREERAPSAFVSFEETSVTTYWIHTDDLQQSHWGGGGWGGEWGGYGGGGWGEGSHDSYERRAVIDKTGVTYR